VFCDDCPPEKRVKSLRPRLFAKIAVTDGCWDWTGGKTSQGYGLFSTTGQNADQTVAHRVVYELLVGPIPEGLVLDHLCRRPNCVRPDHLEPVLFRENVIRGIGPTAINAAKTHCINGHELTPENTYDWPDRGRNCRPCANARTARHKAKKREAAA
jgi:hypothetical protein